MKLQYVSITGPDDKVFVEDLNAIAAEFPFVEWAILLLPGEEGTPRVPSQKWIERFVTECETVNKAMHLCGGAFLGFIEDRQDILNLMYGFKRVQLNLEFGNVEGKYDVAALLKQIARYPEFEFIIQYTDKRKALLSGLRDIPNHSILFDASAGRGVSPDAWPAPLEGHFCGYAGGINPDNVAANLDKIAAAGAQDTWIDMESGVRTNDRFDLEKVRRVLEISAPFSFNH